MWSVRQSAFMITSFLTYYTYVQAGYHYQNPQHQYNNQAPQQIGDHHSPQISYTVVSADNYNNINQNQQYPNYNRVVNNQQQPAQQYGSPHNNNVNQNQQHTPNYYNPVEVQHAQTYYNQPQSHNEQFETQNSYSNSYYNTANTVQQQSQTYSNIENNQVNIKKHIYFHVPPADLETPTHLVTTTAPRKSYKIIFIKLPSQQSNNRVYLQNQFNNLQHHVEQKTLIYVLVKKPEVAETVVQTKTVHSVPQVFYVKYKQNSHELDGIASQVNAQLGANTEVEEEVLQPGLLNGQDYA